MKQHTLTQFFFFNYLCLLIVLLAGVWITNSYSSAKVDEVLSWVDDDTIMNMYEVYEAQGAQAYVNEMRQGTDFSVEYFLLLDDQGVVLDSCGSAYPQGHRLPDTESNRLINDPDTYAFYPDESYDIAIIKLTGDQMKTRINSIMFRAWGSYSFGVVLILLLLTRITASRVVRPIENLTDAVRQVGDGQYEIQADFEARHEVGHLKDALMAMSHKIQGEHRLRTASEADRRQLILNISHDLKTPLTNIRGYSETALTKFGDADETLKNYLTIILNNSLKADTLMRNLFELSRIENAGFLPDLTPQDIGEVVRQSLITYVPELEAAGIEYDFEIPSEPLVALLDAVLIKRALSNLLDNSIRYLAGVQAPVIHISVLQREDTLVSVKVSDNGPGIPEELREQVFKPFVTADISRNRSRDGAGLGLAIARAIFEKHQGAITIEATASPGVSFEILLPLKPDLGVRAKIK